MNKTTQSANLHCSEEPLRRLREAVLKKHGKLHGTLKEEVDIALQERAKKIMREEIGA